MGKEQDITTVALTPPVSPVDEKKDQYDDATLTEVHHSAPKVKDAHRSVGLAVIEQKSTIPQTGERKAASSLEYWLYIVYYIGGQGVGIGNFGGAVQQALLHEQFPMGMVYWGGRTVPLNSMVLDLNGILFAVQLVVLLVVGPYADYGNWRPWLLIVFTVPLWACTLGFAGLKDPSTWQGANALFILGNLALNVSNTFYWAAFPGLVRDLPKMITSEQQVLEGSRSPEAHAELDMLERSKIYNYVNIVGSGGNLVLLGISTGIAYKIGTDNQAQLDKGYQVILGLFGAVTVLTTIPWFLVEKHRPGQQLPVGSGWIFAGPKQVWQAARCAWDLKQTLLYLVAFFLLQDMVGTAGTVTGILQNETVNFSTILFSALTLILYFTGGTGTILVNWVQQKWRFSVRTMILIGAATSIFPVFWGFVGNWTTKIGYHNTWEFWALAGYNFTQAAWGSYNITMISEVVPAPKVYMFFALFNTVGKTSGFIGPFISSAIISRAGGNNNAAFYFLLPMGLLGYAVLWFVNPNKAKIDNARFLEREAKDLYRLEVSDEKELEADVPREI